MPVDKVISAPDVDSIYDIPLNFEKEKLSDKLCDILDVASKNRMQKLGKKWKILQNMHTTARKTIK